MPDRSQSVSNPRAARIGRVLAVCSGVALVAALASDQVNVFIAEAHDVPCHSLDSSGSRICDHVLRAAPFVLILAVNALSWRQASARIFMVYNAAALALSLLYMHEMSMNGPLIPGAGDCMEDVWDDYAASVEFFQYLVMWPFAAIGLAVSGLFWIGRGLRTRRG